MGMLQAGILIDTVAATTMLKNVQRDIRTDIASKEVNQKLEAFEQALPFIEGGLGHGRSVTLWKNKDVRIDLRRKAGNSEDKLIPIDQPIAVRPLAAK
ncbi:MAG TPA: hypothetical protein VGC13_00310 [Longimicrobium sp.]|jgi:proteasome assembly chaperone (PAC2) family protein